MVGHGGSSAGSYLVDPTSPIPSHCASVAVTSTLRVNLFCSVLSMANTHIFSFLSMQNVSEVNGFASFLCILYSFNKS